jgi:hypothetical protein
MRFLSSSAVRAGGVLVFFAVAALAAACAHVAIDALGDVLLAHDTYDDITHDARSVIGAVAFATLLAFGARGMYDAVCAALGRCAARRALVAVARRSAIGAIVALAIPLLLAMEWVDAFLAGAPTSDLTALLGGSIALGLSTTVATAVLTGLVATALLRWCCSTQTLLVRIMVAWCVARTAASGAGFLRCGDRYIRPIPAPVHARHAAKRGPPLPVS